MTDYSIDVPRSRHVFSTVEDDGVRAGSDREKARFALDGLAATANDDRLRQLLTRLRDESVVPGMDAVIGRLDLAVTSGREAVAHVVAGDQQMAGTAGDSSRQVANHGRFAPKPK
ncbi:hypothetical protein BJH93_00170 [Kocuria polaris]|nr:hypothetical protein [Kocuria polaris]